MIEGRTAIGYVTVAVTGAQKILTWVFASYVTFTWSARVENNALHLMKVKKQDGKLHISEKIEIRAEDIRSVKRKYWYIGFIYNFPFRRYKVFLNSGRSIVIQINRFMGKQAENFGDKHDPLKELNLAFDSRMQKQIVEHLENLRKGR